MKPVKILTLVGWAVPAATAGYLASKVISANGGPVPVTPINLILTLVAISVILGAFGVPMVRYRRALTEQLKTPTAPRPKRLNPFYAFRLLILAKATAASGALFAGWHLGVIWLQVSSPVTPDSIWQNLAALIASIAMVIVGLIVERICRIKDDGADQVDNAGIKSPATGKITGTASGAAEKQAQ